MKIGIDIGGTKIEGVVLDADANELARRRVATPTGDYDGTVRAVADLIAELAAEVDYPDDGHVGVGIPGAISPLTGLVKNANSTCLIGRRLGNDLQAASGRPVRLANDADCFAMSEATDGAGAGHGVVFGVILGTGVGGGIVVNGRLLSGRNAIAGEWGHNPLPWPQADELPGRRCYCGKRGCIETFLSGPGLAADHRAATGDDRSAAEIAGSADAADALNRYHHRLARALAGVINILDPDIIVLGGGLSNIASLYTQTPKLWQQWIFSDHCETPLAPNKHGDSSGVRLGCESELSGAPP